MELLKSVKNTTFDDYFTDVNHSETIAGILRAGYLRLFCLNVRNGNIKSSDLEKFAMLNIGRYVFSRAKQENFRNTGNLDSATQQVMGDMRKTQMTRMSPLVRRSVRSWFTLSWKKS